MVHLFLLHLLFFMLLWMVFTKQKLKLYWDKMDLWISQGFNLLLHIRTALWLQHQTHHLLDQTIIVYN